jgi:hypothetical protein
MHWTTHIVSGAAAGYLIGRPVPAALAGFASHLVLDAVPHHDPDSEIGYVIDSLAGLAALVVVARWRRIRRVDPARAALFGACGSALPDVELLVKLAKDIEKEQYLFPAHDGTIEHGETHPAASTAIQLALIGIMLSLALRKMRRAHLKRASEAGESAGSP